jgi:Acyl-CoA dehydrogenase, C-terminal domain
MPVPTPATPRTVPGLEIVRRWERVTSGDPPPAGRRRAWSSRYERSEGPDVEAIELLYGAAGADAVYATSPLDRCLRDARTAVQHICTQEVNYEVVGRLTSGRVEGTMASHWITDYRGEGVA